MAFYAYRKASQYRVSVILIQLFICGFIVIGDQIMHPDTPFYESYEVKTLRAIGALAIIITATILTIALRVKYKTRLK